MNIQAPSELKVEDRSKLINDVGFDWACSGSAVWFGADH
jgi:hypothetical protein